MIEEENIFFSKNVHSYRVCSFNVMELWEVFQVFLYTIFLVESKQNLLNTGLVIPHPPTGLIQASLSKIQGLLKNFPTVFKDVKLMKNTDLHVKMLLLKC